MRVNLISFSFVRGGAAIAALKFSDILRRNGYDVCLISQDGAGYWAFIKRALSWILAGFQRHKYSVKRSLNLFSYPTVIDAFKTANSINHLHWINNDTLSIFDLCRIPNASIVTLHDEWLYCGSEHYADFLASSNEYADGYSLFSGRSRGINWSFFVWKIKMRAFAGRSDLIFTVPSSWMLARAKASAILRDASIYLLPNPIDTDVFCFSEQCLRNGNREKYGLDSDDFVISFGAIDGRRNPVKGGALLDEALNVLFNNLSEELRNKVKIVIFGGRPKDKKQGPFHSVHVGHISLPKVLASIYGMSDCVIVPSYVESFGQVAAEAQACGVPVVAFATSGLTDVVIDQRTGFLAESFSPTSLANQIQKLVHMPVSERLCFGVRARDHVVKKFSYDVVSKMYLEIISMACSKRKAS